MGLEGPNRMLFGLKVELNVSLSSKVDVVPADFTGRKKLVRETHVRLRETP